MKIKITQDDIDKGRMEASKICGCPIWHAVVRQLQVPESQAKDLVKISGYWKMEIGDTKFKLPDEAVSMQRILVEYPLAHIEPFEFFAPVSHISEKKKESIPEDSESESAQSQPAQSSKPGLLQRIFS